MSPHRNTDPDIPPTTGPATRWERWNARFTESRLAGWLDRWWRLGENAPEWLMYLTTGWGILSLVFFISYPLVDGDTPLYLIECPGSPSWKATEASKSADPLGDLAYARRDDHQWEARNGQGHLVHLGSTCTVTELSAK